MGMSFSEALIFLKNGRRLFRSSWNGKNLIVYYHFPKHPELTNEQMNCNTQIRPQFRIWDKDKKTVSSWVPSVSDILDDDWFVDEEKTNE